MLIWYSNPGIDEFSSFYCFFPDNDRVLVRVRLELNRDATKDDNGWTKAIYREKRFYCFGEDGLRGKVKFYINDHGQVYTDPEHELHHIPTDGFYVYDFTMEKNSKGPYKRVHNGNVVIPAKDSLLPPDISEEDLLELVMITVKKRKTIELTPPDASPEMLSKRILEIIGK